MEALIALVGVLFGTLASVGFQIWDKRQGRTAAQASKEGTAATQLLDATWGRIALIVDELRAGDEVRVAFTAYSSARTRWADSGVHHALEFATWVDLAMTQLEQDQFLTYHNALIRHGQITERLHAWQNGDAESMRLIRTERDEMKAQFWDVDGDASEA